MANLWKRRTGPYLEVLRAVWENRDQWPYAWRILKQGVCDGCALGTSGMRDWTMRGMHLCWIRLNLMRLNTMPAMQIDALPDCRSLERQSESQLRRLGRLSHPLLRRRGQARFEPIDWNEALTLAARRIRSIDPRRLAFYLVSRGTVNETYYVAQKVARFLGTNHIDNSARVCHAASTTALAQALGYAATTCSYRDLIDSDLVVFLGSNVANNQPVMMKYLRLARKRGARVAMVNPYREPGMERYWIPSNLDSALFGTRVAEFFFRLNVGGDVAFLNGVLKHLIANGWVDHGFIAEHTRGWPDLVASLENQSFEELERSSGVSRARMLEFARLYARAARSVLVWSMGITQHPNGVDNVRAIVNLALARGQVGRPGTGLMPIRGHSGVQGGAEMACIPNRLPGGRSIDEAGRAELEREWGFPIPAERGYFAVEMVEAAYRGEIEALYAVGSNLMGILPDPERVRTALGRIGLRIHHDIVLNPQALVEPADLVLVLPATTRYEMAGGGTETSTERRVIFNPEIPGPRVPEAREEWRVMVELARRARPPLADRIAFDSTRAIRREIARTIPRYRGIERLEKAGDQFQWGGARLGADGRFGLPDGRARFSTPRPAGPPLAPGRYHLSTRRGKQFNSIVLGSRDMLVGASRQGVVMAAHDMRRLGVGEGARVLLRSGTGEMRARVRSGDIQPGTVMAYWPEANVLIRPGAVDPECGIPAYREATVEVVPCE